MRKLGIHYAIVKFAIMSHTHAAYVGGAKLAPIRLSRRLRQVTWFVGLRTRPFEQTFEIDGNPPQVPSAEII